MEKTNGSCSQVLILFSDNFAATVLSAAVSTIFG